MVTLAPSPPREYLEFYRLDLSRDMRGILVPAALLVATGSAFVCVAAARIPLGVSREALGFVGAAVVLSGLVMGFGGMARLLLREGFVGVTREGIHVRAEARDEFVPWDDVERVASDHAAPSAPRGAPAPIALILRDARAIALPRVTAPNGISIRDRLEELRRKASLNLLDR